METRQPVIFNTTLFLSCTSEFTPVHASGLADPSVTILDIRCPNAEAAGYPTLVHRWDPVDGYLGVCSFCYLNNQGGCETPKYQLTWVRRSPYSSAEYQVAKRGRNRHWGNPKLHEVIRVQLGLAHMPMSIDHSDGQSLQARTPAGGSEQSTDQTTAAQEDVEDPFKQPTSALDLKTPPFGARFPDNFSTTAWTGSLPTVQEETSPLAGKNQGSSSSLAADAEGKKRKAEQDAEQSIKSAKTDTAEGRAEDIVMADHSQTDDLQNKAGSVDNSKLTDEYRQLAQTQQRAQKGKEAAAALKNLLSGRTSASAEPQPAAATQPIEQRAASEPDRSRRAASVSSKQELFATASQPHSTQPRHPPVGFTTGLLSECIKTDVHALNSSCDELMNAADENVQQALDTLKASWQAVQGRIMASKNDSHALENQVIDNVNRSAVFETENARLKESVKEKEMFIRKLEAQITRTRNELDTALHPKTAAEAAAAAHAADKANFEELAKKAGVDRTRAEAQLQEQTAEITELRQKQEEVAKAAEEVLDSYTQETNAKEVLQTENNQLRTEKDVLQTEKDQLQQEKDALARERDESQTSAARLDSSVIELTQKNAELERTLLDLRMSIASPASQFPPSPDHAGPPGESRIPVTPATLATGLGRPPAFSPTAAQTTSAVSPASVLASPHDHTHAHQPQTQQSSPAAQSSLNEPYNPYAARTADAPLLSPGGGPQNTALTGEQAFIEHENVESAAGAADSAAPGL